MFNPTTSNKCPFCGENSFWKAKESKRYYWYKCHNCPCRRREKRETLSLLDEKYNEVKDKYEIPRRLYQ